ncbi:MAG: hypothetical protein KQJ78_20515 [Deltaproteobacteria bacterium]|nr:hypothetical protein [Deltaproteobacteria bacterium]
MDITSVTITPEGNYLVALADGRLLAVPDDPGNADRQAIAEWAAAGGVIQEAVVDLEALRTEAQWTLKRTVDRFAAWKPDGVIRYDEALAGNIQDAATMALAAGQAIPSVVLAAWAWKRALITAYFERKTALAAAATPEELAAVDVSYGWFEERYGVAGSLAPDPDVSTADLAGQ